MEAPPFDPVDSRPPSEPIQLALERLPNSFCRSNYRRLRRAARNQLSRRIRSKIDAGDLLQEAMLRAVSDIRQFRGSTEAEWIAWMQSIIHRARQDVEKYYVAEKRCVAREVTLSKVDAFDAVAGPGYLIDATRSPEMSLIVAEERALFLQALALLPATYRQMIQLHAVEQMTFAAISSQLRCSRAACRKRWDRACAMLMTALERQRMNKECSPAKAMPAKCDG